MKQITIATSMIVMTIFVVRSASLEVSMIVIRLAYTSKGFVGGNVWSSFDCDCESVACKVSCAIVNCLSVVAYRRTIIEKNAV